MDLRLQGKRAIVTGASKGIGLAIARGLTAEGVDVVLAARSPQPLQAAADHMGRNSGRRVIAVPTDTGTTRKSSISSRGQSRNSVVSTSW